MSLYEPMDTDHRQTLFGLNQDNELERLISDVMNHTVSPNALAESWELVKLGNALECLKDTLRSTSRTAKLWLRFMDYIEIIKDSICCERLGMWDGHLNAVTALLNLFAATCIHYAKYARLYVQEMRKLPSTHPWLHHKFVEGCHTVWRSERLWAGLWTDIVIEQVLMRSLKSRGGLTRGRGMTESVRQQWVYSLHACAAIHDAMTSQTGKHHTTSHQHCWARRSKASAWPARHEHISRLVPFTWSIWWQCPTASFSGQRVGLKWGWWHQLWWNRESRQWDTTKSWQCICRKCNHKEASDGAHSEWVEAGGQGAKVDKQLYRSTIRSCSCVVHL